MRSESKCGDIRERSVGQLRAAGVFPRREPERADIGGGIRKLANQDCRGLIVKAVIVFVVERVLPVTRVAVSSKYVFEPAMGAEAGFEPAIRGVINEYGIVR